MAPEILLPSTGESFEFDGVAEIRGLALGSYVWGSTSFGRLWGLCPATTSCGVFSRAPCLTTMTKCISLFAGILQTLPPNHMDDRLSV